jgi:hypothetical protein
MSFLPPIPRGLPVDVQNYLRDFSVAVEREMNRRFADPSPVNSVAIVTNDRKIYSVSVDGAGDVIATLVSE